MINRVKQGKIRLKVERNLVHYILKIGFKFFQKAIATNKDILKLIKMSTIMAKNSFGDENFKKDSLSEIDCSM